MADPISIKRSPALHPLYDAMEQSDECMDHCVLLNGEDLAKFGAGEMPEKGDLVHCNVIGRVVGFGDDHGHRYVRIEITDILFLENESDETPSDVTPENAEA